MSTTPRIFVSHSSRDQALTEAVCAQLGVPTPPHPGFDVLVDFSWLRPGTEWVPQVHAMMAHCQTALILITRGALARPEWVVKETYILSYRHSFEGGFKLFYVTFDGIDDKALGDAGFGPSHLGQIQRIRSEDPAAIAAAIRAEVPAVPAGLSPYEKLVEGLKDNLKLIGDTLLVDIAAKLGTDEPPAWTGPDHRQKFLERIALQLLGVDGKQPGKYTGLEPLFNDLKGTSVMAESLRKILRFSAPYWVSRGAAASVRGLLTPVTDPAGGTCRPAVMNGLKLAPYVSSRYVERAFPDQFSYRVGSVADASGGNFVEYCTGQICDEVRRLDPEGAAGLEDDDIVDDLGRAAPWLFVHLPLPPDHAAFAELQARFPRVTFLLFVGQSLREVRLGEGWSVLEPEIDLDETLRRRDDYRAAQRAVNAP
jgi:hypothetical protein